MTTLSLASLLFEAARRWPDKTGFIEGERQVTFAQAWEGARRVAAELVDRGVQPGAPVGLLAPNTVEFVTGYFGILAAGGTVVPVPTMLQPPETAYLLGNSRAKHVLFHPALAALASEAAGMAGATAIDLTALPADREPLPRLVTRQAEDIAVIFYTSGTTGRPKGALLTHLNMVMNATGNVIDCGMRHEDVGAAALPLFHVYGQSSVLNVCLRSGGTLVLLPRFEPAAALATMAAHQVTSFAGVPTMYVYLNQAARAGAPKPPFTFVSSGGAPIPVAVLEEFEQLFGIPVHEGYGLSETASTATVNQDVFGIEAGSVGHPAWGVEIEAVDEGVDDRLVFLPVGERGEIVVRGHNVFSGYLNEPEATKAAIMDGWFRTGDIGTIDERGFIRIVDRKKDLVIRGGFNVYPREVEEVLMRHPAVNQVAVVGIPDAKFGEEILAVVVPVPGESVDPDELIAWSRERLAHHKHPRIVQVVQELPVGPSQKVLKRELRAQYAEPAASPISEAGPSQT